MYLFHITQWLLGSPYFIVCSNFSGWGSYHKHMNFLLNIYIYIKLSTAFILTLNHILPWNSLIVAYLLLANGQVDLLHNPVRLYV